jgi:hypothetical protein
MLALAAAPAVSAKPMACSAGGDWNPVTESDVIVGGRITAWERRDDLVFPHPPMFTPVELHMEIADVWKGQVRPGEPIIDAASLLEPSLADAQWSGSGGACGALNEDPTGMYAVFGLSRTEQGYLRTNLLTTFWLDDRPYDPAILSASERGFFRLPALGDGSAGDGAAGGGAIFGAIVGGLGVAAVVLGRAERQRRHTA